ncbi:MAG: undecaprenyl-diphosphate phosphatase [Ruminococcus sp.]|nr:undecaprenyl-diphosphate phosphatase [Ruminococcus sp.]
MSVFSAIFQAIIQGLTEFLPVSSSGHLSLYQHFTGNSGEGALMFSAVLHLGTLVAVFFAFWNIIVALIKEFVLMIKDIFTGKFKWSQMNGERRMIIMIVISTACLIPFYIFKGWFEGIAEDSSIFAEGLCFLYTAALLYMSDKCVKRNKKPKDITTKDAVTVGFFQGVALLPGVSRSGSTITSGLFTGFSRSTAVQYSFILGIPAILGGCLIEVKDAVKAHQASVGFGKCFLGFIVAAVVGLCAIKLVEWLVKSDRFRVFAYYTCGLGVLVILISIIEAIMGHPITIG